MADGATHVKYHNRFWIPALICSGILSFLLFKHNILQLILFNLFFVLNYWMGENLVSCDLDLLSISGQDGRMLTEGKKNIFIGFLGLLFALWSMVYSWIMQFLGGHRNIFSHGIILGTLGRILWFNIPIIFILSNIYSFGVVHWHWSSNFSYELYLDIWLVPYLCAQFLAWFITDDIHIILDTDFAKNRLYTPIKR